VLSYEDFGPQAAAYSYIGSEWYQWDNHGGANPNIRYDVKVVVYDGMSLREVKRRYPVDEARKLDYRYLSLQKAEKYIAKYIEELPSLERTQLKLHQGFRCF